MATRPDPSSRYPVTDVNVLRLLAHPLRARILGALRLEGEATATQLGRRLGESSGATSYHLRQLAQAGLVVESPDQRSKRERVWRAGHALTSIDPRHFHDDVDPTALDEFSRRQVDRFAQQALRWVSRRPDADAAWAAAGGFSDLVVRLTPASCEVFVERALDLLHELEAASVEEQDAAWVSVFLATLPQNDDEVL